MLKLCFFGILVALCNAQNMRGARNAPKPIKGRRRESGGSLFRSLTINYPLSMFKLDAPDWRSKAAFSSELASLSSSEKPYLDIARAQDQEDVWIYENWFYGMKNGVIMESGALNGILFSTSFMFEHFANWSTIHVGMLHCS